MRGALLQHRDKIRALRSLAKTAHIGFEVVIEMLLLLHPPGSVLDGSVVWDAGSMDDEPVRVAVAAPMVLVARMVVLDMVVVGVDEFDCCCARFFAVQL